MSETAYFSKTNIKFWGQLCMHMFSVHFHNVQFSRSTRGQRSHTVYFEWKTTMLVAENVRKIRLIFLPYAFMKFWMSHNDSEVNLTKLAVK